ARYSPDAPHQGDRNVPDQESSEDGPPARPRAAHQHGPRQLRHVRRRVRRHQLAPRPARHAGAGRGPECGIGQPVGAAGQPAAGSAGKPRAAARDGAGPPAARLMGPAPRACLSGALVLALAFACAGVASARDADARAPQVAAVDELPPGQEVSDTVIELAGWVVASKDSQGYPFAIMDKAAAQILVFGGDGRLRGAAPALFGSAVGDHTAPGIAGLALREIPGRDRTTPAGRFVGGFGQSIDAGRVLWVDYDAAVSTHPTATGVPSERRPERLASPTPDDNRISHGCINVSPAFYEQIMEPTFERGGVFYILPDKASLAETFPEFAESRAQASR